MTYQEYLKAIAEQLEINHRSSSSNPFICNAVVAYRNANLYSYSFFKDHEEKLCSEVSQMLSVISAHYFYEYFTLTALGRYYAEKDALRIITEPILSQLQARLRFLKELAEKD